MNTEYILFELGYLLNNIPIASLFAFIVLSAIPLPLSAFTPLFYAISLFFSYYISYFFPTPTLQTIITQYSLFYLIYLTIIAYLIGLIYTTPIRLLSMLSYSPSSQTHYHLLPICFQSLLCLEVILELHQPYSPVITLIQSLIDQSSNINQILFNAISSLSKIYFILIIELLPFFLLTTFQFLFALLIPKTHQHIMRFPAISALIELTMMIYLFPMFSNHKYVF